MKFFNLYLLFLFGSILVSKISFGQEFEFVSSQKIPLQNIGGKEGIERIIKNEFVYPSPHFKNETEGLVKIQYQLKSNGETMSVKTLSATNEDFQEIAEWIFSKIEFKQDKNRIESNVYEFRLIFSPKKHKKLLKKRVFEFPPQPFIPIDSSGTIFLYNKLSQKPTPLFKEKNYQSIDHYFNSKIKYPEAAIRLGISGQVVLEYVVEQSGLVSNINVVESLQGGCNEEAIRVLESLTFNPGVLEGKAVRVKMKTRVNFGARGY
jgi:TonB family protein